MNELLDGLLNDLRNIRGATQSDEFDLRRCREQVEEIQIRLAGVMQTVAELQDMLREMPSAESADQLAGVGDSRE